MKVLFDFGSIRQGGGVQLATNFLDVLSRRSGEFEEVHLLVPTSGELARKADTDRFTSVLHYPTGYVHRAIFEQTTLRSALRSNRIDAVYTFFGAGLGGTRAVHSVVSVAYPIICNPDSVYWNYVPRAEGIRKKAVNVLRRARIRRADIVVVETDLMARRLHRHAGVEPRRIRIIPPSPSRFVRPAEYEPATGAGHRLRILLLSGPQAHKNLWRLPALAAQLEIAGLDDFEMALSVERSTYERHLESSPVENSTDIAVIDRRFRFLGPVPVTDVGDAYEDADLLLNLSDLESFSNNYMEAWTAGTPLVCSDRDFAREICGGSAVYVEPHEPADAAASIMALVGDHDKQRAMVDEGKQRLAELPGADARLDQMVECLGGVSR